MVPSPRSVSVARMVQVLIIWCGFTILIGSQVARAQSPQMAGLQNAPMIFDVRRSLPLEPDEPVYHDFYINAGPEAGFRKGAYVTVVRVVNVHDPVQNKQQGELNVVVARLQVLHVERTLTVARLDNEFNDEDRPVLEFEAVMIGDRVDTSSITMTPPGSKKKFNRRGAKADQGVSGPEAQASVSVTLLPRESADARAPQVHEAAMKNKQLVEPSAELASAISTMAPEKNTSQPANVPAMVRLPIPVSKAPPNVNETL